ncbi:MAG: GNAT family N-acetyltransferase [Brevefilum sp.]|nr:GNAT family N-acetyltransferase [Brevefilum sp.]MDT8381503.1 GNAT family N-acetyltransferase [Brevefilum sp.]
MFKKGPAVDEKFLMRLEDAALNAWPAPRQMIFNGWLLRFADGYTKRANSVNVRRESKLPLQDKIRACEWVYEREGLPLIFRLPDPFISQALLEALDIAGYQTFDPTYVLGQAIGTYAALPEGVRGVEMDVADWIALRADLTGSSLEHWRVHRQILEVIVPRKVLLGLLAEGEYVACGMGVVEGDLLGYFSIYVGEDFRRRGYGQMTMTGLTNWGLDQGARYGYLQVEGDNDPALVMYQKMGFETCYRYVYSKKKVNGE